MEPWQERVLAERADLHKKIVALGLFLHKKPLVVDGHEEGRLVRQHNLMLEYLRTLDDRINAW